jgi:hypothetical protein
VGKIFKIYYNFVFVVQQFDTIETLFNISDLLMGSWTVDRVGRWLKDIGFQKHIQKFEGKRTI